MSRVLLNAGAFREKLRRQLTSKGDQIVLRILLSPREPPLEFTGRDLLGQSTSAAERYSNAPQGSVVLLLLPHSAELFLLHIGLLLTGRVPAILAWPTNRVDAQKYQRNLVHQLQSLPAAELITLPLLARNLLPSLPYVVTSIPNAAYNHLDKIFDLGLPNESDGKAVSARTGAGLPDDVLFLQFSGGTTGAQKCVVVTAAMLDTQLALLARTLSFGSDDAVVSWLPMYHDMGLIACLWLPLWTGAASLQIAAQDWLMDPGLLFRLTEQFRGTFCWMPNFAFSYLAAQKARMRPSSLGHVRAWINCSEPVRRQSIEAFTATFAAWGVRQEQCQSSYAMAENVFAVTQSALGSVLPTVPRRGLRSQPVSSREISFDFLDEVYVSSGQTLSGMQLRIRNLEGGLCGDLEPGNIEIHTPCMFSGYWGTDGFQTHALTADGWYGTGDYGFRSGSELFVIGRTKDIVIVGGQNVFPEDVEVLANTVAGVYTGRVVAFGLENAQQGTEDLVVVAEMRGAYDPAAAKKMEKEISRAVLSGIGIAPRFVRVKPEHWIIKSTAGKISRRETRLRFVEDADFVPVGAGSRDR